MVDSFLKKHETRIYDDLSNSSEKNITSLIQKVADFVIYPEITIDVNVNGTTNVLKACIQNKIRKIIFASSAFVYGDCNKLPITEKSDTCPTSPYVSSYQLRMK